ncbi:Hydrolase [Candidatus Rhodobacter oscarellae]|uniref:Hydrolase n=1 Tax=Candidatus Rhodobacter oscarellae TaxID=1675527 RepID=A0A0J9E894_9RHOB|nr:HAD family phosphatase [Candidatus Rhodobacter lobularis]KMW58951.1 Hydrolase [Candidatus Rhodobacter lobularis]
MTIKAVVFDIGNVLVEWYPERPFDRILGEARRKELFAQIDFDTMNLESDRGIPMAEGLERLVDAHPEHAAEIRLWGVHWLEMLAPDLPHSAKLLRALRAKGMPVYALSNFGDMTFAMAEERYPILKEFDKRFVSARMGVIKPDPAIYQMLEEGVDEAPEALLFIDDRAENIDAAQARGWHGHLFETEQGLADRLMAEGLLTEAEAAP